MKLQNDSNYSDPEFGGRQEVEDEILENFEDEVVVESDMELTAVNGKQAYESKPIPKSAPVKNPFK